MQFLIIGGTLFLGRHLVEAARARGHQVTLFHRGKTNPGLFPDVLEVLGDRTSEADLAALAGQRFDAVIDTCGYVPRVVGMSAAALATQASLYCFISTVSVYAGWPETPADETAPLAVLEDPTTEVVDGKTYGGLKALCEKVVEEAFPGRSLIIRPGLIVGPHDPSDRFTYWPHRIAQGGDVLAPAGPELPTQWIDVRDLAEWTIQMLEGQRRGVYNGDGPVIGLGQLLATCLLASGAQATITYVDEPFLQEQGVGAWMELPLWIPGLYGRQDGGATRTQRASMAGLKYRSVLETVRDTLVWDKQRPQENAWRAALKPEKEAAVLAAWRASRPE